MARQFLSSDTSLWREGFGNGIDGVKTVSSNETYDGVRRSCSGTSGATTLTLGSSGFTNGMPVLIHQTRGTGAGSWELNKITSGGGTTTLTLAYELENTYTDSGDSQAQVVELKQYSSVTVNNTYTWSAPEWDGDTGGILAFLCNGSTTVTGAISAVGKGFRGGVASVGGGSWSGEGTGGASNASPDVFGPAVGNGAGTSGNSGTYTAVNGGITGGGVGGGGNSGGTVYGGEDAGNASLTVLVLGGGGSSGENSNDASAGDGGGIVCIFAPRITVTGSVSLAGNAGGNATGGQNNGGGGGGAGCALFKAHILTLGSGLVTALGGSGGTGTRAGGVGGVGRIHADYLYSISGTTNPTIDTDQDNVLLDRGAGFIMNLM